jgi:hypothetical protein
MEAEAMMRRCEGFPGGLVERCCLLKVDAEVPEVAQKKLSSGSGEGSNWRAVVGRRLLVLVLELASPPRNSSIVN